MGGGVDTYMYVHGVGRSQRSMSGVAMYVPAVPPWA